ncbi:MAG TPA: type III pantothenate kinase [Rhodocyclaceae bacterium]|nr:type III pantothenate kinase [Rhodocyclaceae bacterium]
MILCLDCGNTRIKWGLRSDANPDGAWLAQGAVSTREPTELVAALSPYDAPELAVACNVAGAVVKDAIDAALSFPVLWNGAQPEQCGVRNGYEVPQQLGADRWAALIGARALHDGPCLVVSAGTATTVDVLDADGQFRGGLILPGLDLMRAALAGNTAQLPADSGAFIDLPRKTVDAITSGAINATLGAIERMFRQLIGDQALCLLTGGAAPLLLPHLPLPVRHEPLLVLEGLACVAGSR